MRLIMTIDRLTTLAASGRSALASNNLDRIGEIMAEAWLLHQELDPNCSNPFVDNVFQSVSHLSSGHKLVGDGGGGFAILIAKTMEASFYMKILLREFGPPVEVINWSLCEDGDLL
jgi:fucokinase